MNYVYKICHILMAIIQFLFGLIAKGFRRLGAFITKISAIPFVRHCFRHALLNGLKIGGITIFFFGVVAGVNAQTILIALALTFGGFLFWFIAYLLRGEVYW